MSSIVTSLIDYLRSKASAHPNRTRLLMLLCAYVALRRVLVRRKSVLDNVVLITGGGSGVGRQVASRFALLGAKVVLWDINEAGLQQSSRDIASAGGKVWAYTVDVTDKQMVDHVADRVKREVGKVDILINNAGIVAAKSIVDLTQQEIEKTFAVNVISQFWTIQAFLPDMIATNRGHICTIASGAGHLGINKLSDYCASKFACVGLDESLRMELKRKGLNGVVTTCCSSYFISTGQFEGAKASSSWLLPVLTEDYVSDKIVDAILTEQSDLRMPRMLYLVPLFKFFLPTPLFDRVVSFIGLNNSLDDFKGSPLIRLSGGKTKLLGASALAAST